MSFIEQLQDQHRSSPYQLLDKSQVNRVQRKSAATSLIEVKCYRNILGFETRFDH